MTASVPVTKLFLTLIDSTLRENDRKVRSYGNITEERIKGILSKEGSSFKWVHEKSDSSLFSRDHQSTKLKLTDTYTITAEWIPTKEGLFIQIFNKTITFKSKLGKKRKYFSPKLFIIEAFTLLRNKEKSSKCVFSHALFSSEIKMTNPKTSELLKRINEIFGRESTDQRVKIEEVKKALMVKENEFNSAIKSNPIFKKRLSFLIKSTNRPPPRVFRQHVASLLSTYHVLPAPCLPPPRFDLSTFVLSPGLGPPVGVQPPVGFFSQLVVVPQPGLGPPVGVQPPVVVTQQPQGGSPAGGQAVPGSRRGVSNTQKVIAAVMVVATLVLLTAYIVKRAFRKAPPLIRE
ncbi:MAG: hypothetical protein K1060chlam2_00508 [Chlamydiae bacterium]|nr:hypothetical protein [Chlamydiota bacterium]